MPTFFVPWSPVRRSITPYGQAGTQYPQPLQMSSCTTTVPNSVRNRAPVGHTSRQAAFVQCLHATSHALQPMQIEVSVKNPLRGGGAAHPACRAGSVDPNGCGLVIMSP